MKKMKAVDNMANNIYDLKSMNQQGIAGSSAQNTGQQVKQNAVGIREALRSRYGINNNDIGYSNGWVTVKGQNLMKPDWIDDSGTSYVGDAGRLQKAVSDMYAAGDVGIRSEASRYGLDSNKFGYANGRVTYDGQDFAAPSRVTNGVSYTDRDSMMNAVVNQYKRSGKNVVKATDYLSNSGYPFSVDYNSGTVSIGGQTIKPLFVENGKAYVDSAEIDEVIGRAKAQNGIRNRTDIAKEYENRYGSYYDKLLDAIANRKSFSYDAEKDPVYQSYEEQYSREGDRAMRNALGNGAALTGGYTNSAAATAANAQRAYWSDKLMDRIPELSAQAYSRYVNDFNMNREALSDVMGLDNMQYSRAYGANDDAIGDVRYNNQLAELRRQYLDQRADTEYERRLDSALDPYTVEAARLANEQASASNALLNHQAFGQGLQNRSAEFENLLAKSLYAGDWVDYELARSLGIDPERSKPRDYEQWQSKLATDADLDSYARKLALQQQYSRNSTRSSTAAKKSSKTNKEVKPSLTFSQMEEAIKSNNITPNVLAAYEYYYGVPYGSKTITTSARDENGNEYKKLYVY